MALRPELVVQTLVALATGLLYVAVARLIAKRELSADAVNANRLFAVWWGAFAGLYLLLGLFAALAMLDALSLGVSVALIYVMLILICVGVWGLMSYLVFLYTGSARWFAPLAAAYAILAGGLVALIAWMRPLGFKEGGFRVQLEYAQTLPEGPSAALGLVFALPVVLAAIAYARLYFRVDSSSARYRIAMVSGAFIFWFGWSVVSGVFGIARRFPDSVALYVWNQAIAVVVPILIILAYRPPRWVRERLADAAGA